MEAPSTAPNRVDRLREARTYWCRPEKIKYTATHKFSFGERSIFHMRAQGAPNCTSRVAIPPRQSTDPGPQAGRSPKCQQGTKIGMGLRLLARHHLCRHGHDTRREVSHLRQTPCPGPASALSPTTRCPSKSAPINVLSHLSLECLYCALKRVAAPLHAQGPSGRRAYSGTLRP